MHTHAHIHTHTHTCTHTHTHNEVNVNCRVDRTYDHLRDGPLGICMGHHVDCGLITARRPAHLWGAPFPWQ
ncbi:hypothetical protein LEMLEM_LOCUS8445, partial [Lemmus lemmus]